MNVQSQPRQDHSRMSIDAFFDWIEGQERRYELVEGVPRMMPWVKRNHSIIVSNLDYAIQSRIDRSSLRVCQGDFALQTGPASIRYADLMVEPNGQDGNQRTTQNAIILAEVLSDSTTHVDFGPKREEYLGLEKLDTYLILAQNRIQAWQWARDEQGEWPIDPAMIDEGNIELARIGIAIDVAELYLNVFRPPRA